MVKKCVLLTENTVNYKSAKQSVRHFSVFMAKSVKQRAKNRRIQALVQVSLPAPPFASVTLRVAGHPSGTANAKECHTKPWRMRHEVLTKWRSVTKTAKIKKFIKFRVCDAAIGKPPKWNS